MRADKNYPDVYFGRPGYLIQMPYPRGGIARGYERAVYDFATAGGQHIVSTLGSGSRPIELNWNALHVDNYAKVEQFWTGMMGRGPWALVDPSVTNMLLPNVASATNFYADARGFAVSVAGALSSTTQASQVHRTGATRSLRCLWASAPGAVTPVISMTPPYRSWYGLPVVVGKSYAFSFWAKPDGVIDTSITLSARMRWYGPTGSLLSEITGGDIATTAWTRHSIVGVAPAGAAFVSPVVTITGSTVAAGGSLYLDEFLLENDTVLNPWAPGTGIKAVEILGLTDLVPFNASFRQNCTMVVRELAA